MFWMEILNQVQNDGNLSGNRIIAASAPGVTAQEPADGKVEALEGAVSAEGFEGVLGACRGKAAAGGLERGDADLIEPYQEHKRGYRYFPDDSRHFFTFSLHH